MCPRVTKAFAVIIGLGLIAPIIPSLGCAGESAKVRVADQRKRLATLETGMSSVEVMKILGKPDEVRRVSENHLLDGTRLLSGRVPEIGPETERWAYGILGKGMFAAGGFVSIDRNGRVVAAMSADCFSGRQLPDQVPAASDEIVQAPGKMSCHLGPIEFIPAAGESSESLRTNVTLKNSGTQRFELKHDAARSIRRFLVIEVYDATGFLLFRDEEMRKHSQISFDSTRWPVLSIPPGSEESEELFVSPANGFGPLPPGRYSVRAYFPFEQGKLFPSNLVRFELTKGERTKSHSGQARTAMPRD